MIKCWFIHQFMMPILILKKAKLPFFESILFFGKYYVFFAEIAKKDVVC